MKKFIPHILILLLSSSCNNSSEHDAPAAPSAEPTEITLTPAQANKALLQSDYLSLRKLSRHLRVNGVIDVPPQNMISISFPPGGYLQSTRLLPGMHIRKGEVIAIMQESKLIQLQQDYLSALIRDRQLEADYRRQQELNRDKTSSDKSLQEAETQWRSNKVNVKSLSEQLLLAGFDPASIHEENISRSVALRSPIDGYVATVKVNTGAYINPGDVLFELVDPDDIHLNMTVFEKDVAFLRIGQKVRTWSNSRPDIIFNCEIILVGKELDDHRSVEVHCHFDKYDHSLIPGMFMNAEIEVEEQELISLPEDAIVKHRDRDYIFEDLGNYRYRLTEVGVGLQENGFAGIHLMNTDKPVSDAKNKYLKRRFVVKNAYTLLMQLKNTGEEE
jgi:cobalt-zinc-cadmium efflux system membrane fusion protein